VATSTLANSLYPHRLFVRRLATCRTISRYKNLIVSLRKCARLKGQHGKAQVVLPKLHSRASAMSTAIVLIKKETGNEFE